MHRAHRHTPFVSQSLRGPPENPDRKGCARGIDFQTPHLLSSRDPGLQLSPSSRTRSRQTEKVPEREGHATPKPWRPAPPSRRSGRRVPLRGPHGKARLLEGSTPCTGGFRGSRRRGASSWGDATSWNEHTQGGRFLTSREEALQHAPSVTRGHLSSGPKPQNLSVPGDTEVGGIGRRERRALSQFRFGVRLWKTHLGKGHL